MKKLLLLFIPIVFFFGCDIDTTPDFYAEIDVVSGLESTLKYRAHLHSEYFYLTGDNTSASLTTQTHNDYGGDYSYSLDLTEVEGIGCIDFEIRIYKNGILKQTENFQLGWIAEDDYCNTSGMIFEGLVE